MTTLVLALRPNHATRPGWREVRCTVVSPILTFMYTLEYDSSCSTASCRAVACRMALAINSASTLETTPRAWGSPVLFERPSYAVSSNKCRVGGRYPPPPSRAAAARACVLHFFYTNKKHIFFLPLEPDPCSPPHPNTRLLPAADPGLDEYYASIEAMGANRNPTIGTLITFADARERMKSSRPPRGTSGVSLAAANNHPGCSGGTPTRYAHRTSLYHRPAGGFSGLSCIREAGGGLRITQVYRGRRSPGVLFPLGCAYLA